MGWFSSLFREAVSEGSTSPSTTVTSEVQSAPHDALREKFTSGKVSDQLMLIRKLLMTLEVSNDTRKKYLFDRYGMRNHAHYGSVTGNPWPHRKQTIADLDLLKKALADVDIARSNLTALSEVLEFCNNKLPQMFRELEINIGRKIWAAEGPRLQSMSNAISEVLSIVTKLPTNRSILNLDSPTANSSEITFPNLAPYTAHEKLSASLDLLKKDWDKAVELSLSAEDAYVIEQVGISYLPDALLLFERFCNRTGSTNSEKALAIVEEQVNLIHQQVLFVLEQNEEDGFDMMQVHTDFLKMKNSNLGVPSDLTLEKAEKL